MTPLAEPGQVLPLPKIPGVPRAAAIVVAFLIAVFGTLLGLRLATGVSPLGLDFFLILTGATLVGLAVPISVRVVRAHFLWSLRNKLIVTYLLIGLAPAVLFVTLVAISAYIAAGQFSIHLADTRINQELSAMGDENAARIGRMARALDFAGQQQMHPPPPRRPGGRPNLPARPTLQAPAPAQAQTTEVPAASGESVPNPLRALLHRSVSAFLNGAPVPNQPGPGGLNLPGGPGGQDSGEGPLGLPPWATDLHGREFRSLVADGDDLFLVAIDQRPLEHTGGTLTMVSSVSVDPNFIDLVAEGLGRVRLAALMTNHPRAPLVRTSRQPSLGSEIQRTSIVGGSEPGPVNLADLLVPFVSTVDVTDWETGQPDNIPIEVHSRPSLLYRQLFGASLGGIVTNYIRNGLIALSALFAVIEALALWMAMRVSRSITASVSELYAATQYVDRGDLGHRIGASVASNHDQLGELARSFNRMTGSLERLLDEQKEKERLQSELSIAQEVQANLFPHHARNLPNLELHGICRPARSVSGDYYDFLVFHDRERGRESEREFDGSGEPVWVAQGGNPAALAARNGHGKETGVGIVLGDISGKGISAALLMATLHSAVRAYRFASEDLVYSERSLEGIGITRDDPRTGDTGMLFQSPGRILSLLNRHLYRSTQPEKYATLFLAHYDAKTAQLTYSNAGHLPPFVLGCDNKVRRLDLGGTVVGLIDGESYPEGRVQLHRGDILIAYSDGVTEPENEFGEFGEARLLEVVTRYRDQPLHVISAQVMLALDAWIGAAEQPDDITLVLARQL